jgi:hypothetical protein
MPSPPTVLGEVAKAMATQATPWQSTSRYLVRVGKTLEAFIMKLYGYLPGLQRMVCVVARLSRSGDRFCLLPGEDLPPPIGVGGEDLSTVAEALACQNVAIYWPSRQVTH